MRDLGGAFDVIDSETPVDAVLGFAYRHSVTQIVVGESRRSRWKELTQGSFVTAPDPVGRATSTSTSSRVASADRARVRSDRSIRRTSRRPPATSTRSRASPRVVQLVDRAGEDRVERERRSRASARASSTSTLLCPRSAASRWRSRPRRSTAGRRSPEWRPARSVRGRAPYDYERPHVRHRPHAACASARLSSRTLHALLPEEPEGRAPRCAASISDRTCSSGRPRTCRDPRRLELGRPRPRCPGRARSPRR